ncbi:MAG: S8 family serine peptidase [Bacteroidota bacterium]
MKKYFGTMLSLWICLWGNHFLLAQSTPPHNQLPSLTNQKELKQLQIQAKTAYQISYSKAMKLARQQGWIIRKTTADGRTIALQGLNEWGMPVYYTTYNNSFAAATTRTNQLYTGGTLGLNLSGNSLSVSTKLGVWDDGSPRITHQELANRVTQMDGVTSDTHEHSTHVSGTLIATGLNAVARGMAYGAKLKAWDFNNDISEMTAAADNLLVSNHSYGTLAGWDLDSDLPGSDNNDKWRWYGDVNVSTTEDYKFGFYSEQAKQWDQIVYNAPFYLPVKSAGNNRGANGPPSGTTYRLGGGTTTSTDPRNSQNGYDLIAMVSTAKNILTVGAVYPIPNGYQNASNVRIAPFSSWGPTDDGRIKPDIVGDGIAVTSCTASTDNAYGALSGTSMATPNVSGSLLLLQELYAKQKNGNFMWASTLKGLAIHTADEAGTNTGPDYMYGWGLLNTEKAAKVIINTEDNHLLYERTLAQGETFTLPIIASGKEPLVATICWTDPEGTALPATAANLNNRTPRLVNDLDLRISDGSTYTLPWTLDPNNPGNAATRGNNIRDNVEQVLIENTIPGKMYTLKVAHKGDLQQGPQNYSLWVSGVGTATYCTSKAINATGARINNVTFGQVSTGGFNNTPPAGCTTYTDFTYLSASVSVGQETPIPLSISLGTCDNSSNKIAKVFIDWNLDKDFTDANELVATSAVINGNNLFTVPINVPDGLAVGYITRMRIVCVETNDPTQVTSCGSYTRGETQDYTIRCIRRQVDVGAVGLYSPETGVCANTAQPISVIIQNFGSSAQTNIPVTTVVHDDNGTVATLSNTFVGTLLPFEQVSVTMNGTFNTVAGSAYTFLTSTNLPGDLKASNNQHTATRTISGINPAPVATAAQCGDDLATLKGTGNGTLFWYDAPTGGTLLAVGNAASSTVIPADRTYYAALNDFSAAVGPVNKKAFAEGSYGQFNPMVLFTSQIPLMIESARLYIGHAGKILFSVKKLDGTVVSSTTLDVSATRSSPETGETPDDPNDMGAIYNLNLTVPAPGNYQIAIAYQNGATIFRNKKITNAGYPFLIPGIVSITGNTASASGGPPSNNYYYYLYDLRIKAAGCTSLRTAVAINNEPTLEAHIAVTGNTTLCNGQLVTIKTTAIGSQTYQWKKNGINLTGAIQATYQAGETGIYTVEIARGNCLAMSNMVSVTVFEKPIVTANLAALSSSQPSNNQWLLNKVAIPGATQQTYTALQSGHYSVRSSQKGCPDQVSDEINVIVTATMNPLAEPTCQLYPNPATDNFKVEYIPTHLPKEVMAAIYNAQGAIILTQELRNDAGIYKETFDIAGLANGLYFVRVMDDKNTFVKALVKH